MAQIKIFYFLFLIFLSKFSLLITIKPENNEHKYSSVTEISLDKLYENFSSYRMSEIIQASIELMKIYVYSDIIQNPPNENYYPKINITEELIKINTSEDRPFYDFYREYKKTLNKLKDINLILSPEKVPLLNNTINFTQYIACLPFQLRMDYDENNEIKIFIKDFPYCREKYNKSIQNFIIRHENDSLVSINNQDPFEFIQNFGKEFYDTKNPHARFSFMLRNIHLFFLFLIPLNKEELSMINFSFGENEEDNINLDYYIFKDNDIFDKNEMKNRQGFGNFFEINNNFMKLSNLNNSNNSDIISENEIEWDYISSGMFCKVDEKNELNIFLLKNFDEDDFDNNINIITKCTDLFFSNDYKIIGVISNSLGGSYKFSYILSQLLQPKINTKYNLAQRINTYNKQYYFQNYYSILNPDSCLPFDNLADFKGTSSDDYGDNIIHHRTNIYNVITKENIEKINKLKERIINEGIPKYPTDIIIFTDYISSGCAGLFIKNLQNNGGAIIAGYLGNPKIPENYDSTESSSIYTKLEWTEINNIFHQNGFEIKSLTFAETFGNYNKTEDNKLFPDEYIINKVDERTNIIHDFNYYSYNEFISEAKTIFKKYNEDKKCNKDNSNLLFMSKNCANPKEHIYGGYACENGKWSNDCKKKFCDIGYYYNPILDKCEKDPCTTDQHIIFDIEGEKEYQIMPNITYIFEFIPMAKVYSLKSPIDNLILKSDFNPCPRYCIFKNNEDTIFYVNYFQKLIEPVTVIISGKTYEGGAYSYKMDKLFISEIQSFIGKTYYSFQFNQKEFGYINTFDRSCKIFYTEYNDDITLDDVVKVNTEFFKNIKDKIIEFQTDKIYLFAIETNTAFIQIYLVPPLNKEINIVNNNYNMLYLETGKEYNLNINNSQYPFLIKLKPISEFESSLVIKYHENVQTLNSSNKYYIPILEKNNISFTINNITENAFIEILSSFDEESTEILNDTNLTNKLLNKELTLIEFSYREKDRNKNMEIFIHSEETYGLGVSAGFTKIPYFLYSKANNPKNSDLTLWNYQVLLNNPIKNITLEEGEKYYISILINKSNKNQTIYLTYYYNENPIEDLYEELPESYTTDLIKNLISLIDGYIYLDYAQNPQYLTNYTHKPIDLKKALNNVNIKGRKFYEFYREIKEILGTVHDMHFNIVALKTSKGKYIDKITACIPFKFYVGKDIKDNNKTKIYIKYFEDCATFFDEDVKAYIKNKSDEKIALKSINDEDPFDYIQNWGWKYLGTKNPHGEFSLKKTVIHSFYLMDYPMTPDELNIKYEFESYNKTRPDYIILDYFIFFPNFQIISKLYTNKLFSTNNLLNNYKEDEFNDFFEEEIKKYKNNIKIPNIFEMLEKYFEQKGILKFNNKKEQIKWDYQTKEKNGIKCHFDPINKIHKFFKFINKVT